MPRLLTYDPGVAPSTPDMPLVRSIVGDAAASNYRFPTVVLGS